MDNYNLITPREVEELFSPLLKTSTLSRLRALGGGPSVVKLGSSPKSRVFYKKEEVENWLKDNIDNYDKMGELISVKEAVEKYSPLLSVSGLARLRREGKGNGPPCVRLKNKKLGKKVGKIYYVKDLLDIWVEMKLGQ